MKYCSLIKQGLIKQGLIKQLARASSWLVGIMLVISLVGCQQKPSQHNPSQHNQPAIEQEKDKRDNQPLCKKIGERCRLRPGVLGVCSPSSSQPNHELIQQIAPNPLHCTPQH